MQAPSIQSAFLEEVRKRLPTNVALADELAEVLSISRDSAYRRIRGETILSLDEVSSVCKHFKISVDQIISPGSDMVAFHSRFVTNDGFTFEKWLQSIDANLDMIRSSREHEMIISAKDVPIFYYFNMPDLAAFKMFFWMKSILRYRDFQEQRFSPALVPKSLLALGRRIHDKFTSLHRTELWSHDTIHASLRQIEFYHDCGLFADATQGKNLCDELLQVLRDVRESAAAGRNATSGEPYDLFKNEILIADNTFLFKMQAQRQIFINHNTLNVLSTTHEAFCRQTENYLLHLVNKATKISGTGEKERSKFFNTMEEKVNSLKKRLSFDNETRVALQA